MWIQVVLDVTTAFGFMENVNQSKIFVVGLEIDLRNADAERLSFFEKLASETGGRFKMIGSEKLVRNPLSSESE